MNNVDAPIIDIDDEEDDIPQNSSRGTGSTGRKKRSSAEVLKTWKKFALDTTGVTDSQRIKDNVSQRKSFQDLADIRKLLSDQIRDKAKKIATPKKDEGDTKVKTTLDTTPNKNYNQRLKEFRTQLFQRSLMKRLDSIDHNLKKGSSSGFLAGLLPKLLAGGALGGLIKLMLGDKNPKAMATSMLSSVLKHLGLAYLVKNVISKGFDAVKSLIKKTPGFLKTAAKAPVEFVKRNAPKVVAGLKAGATFIKNAGARLLSSPLATLRTALSGAAGGGLSRVWQGALVQGLKKIGLQIIPRVLGGPIAWAATFAQGAKMIWDYILPQKWKEYISYKVSKLYLKTIDKVADMFMWIHDTIHKIGETIKAKYEALIARISSAGDFLKSLITGEGDARKRVVTYIDGLWTSVKTSMGNYVTQFTSLFSRAYREFIAPFYDANGNFSLLQGAKHYAQNAGDAISRTVKSTVDAANNTSKIVVDAVKDTAVAAANAPEKMRSSAEQNVKDYEGKEKVREQAKKDAIAAAAKKRAEQVAAAKKKAEDYKNRVGGLPGVAMSMWEGITQKAAAVMMGDTTPAVATPTEVNYIPNSSGGASGGGGSNGGYVQSPNAEPSVNPNAAAPANVGSNQQVVPSNVGSKTQYAGGYLGGLISSAESGGGDYSIYNTGTARAAGRIDFSKMTLDQVMDLQARGKVFAVGKYQIIPKTMRGAKDELKLSGKETFTNALQERIFKDYLVGSKRKVVRDYIQGKSNNASLAVMQLAQEFASVAAPYDTTRVVDLPGGRKKYVPVKAGNSYYSDIGGNKAHISAEQALAALNAQRDTYIKSKGSGAEHSTALATAFNTGYMSRKDKVPRANASGAPTFSAAAAGSMPIGSSDTSSSGGESAAPDTRSPVQRLFDIFKDPIQIANAYNQAKTESYQDVVNQASSQVPPQPTMSGLDFTNSSLGMDIKDAPARTNKPYEIKTATDKPAEKPDDKKLSATATRKDNPKSIGASQGNLLDRANLANVYHENSYPTGL